MEINGFVPGLTDRKKYTPRMGCPNCDRGDRTIRFDWKLALESPESDFGKYAQTLQEEKALRAGFLFQCPTCPQRWYLDPAREIMSAVPPERFELLLRWGSAPLSLSPVLLDKISLIGATPAHTLSAEKNYAEVPCRVRTAQGGWIDRCLVVFKAPPPLETFYKKVHLASDIADIEPSEFALAHPIRFNTSRSKEEKPGQFHTFVESKKSGPLALNGTVNFLDHKGSKGKDMLLASGTPKPGKKRVPVIVEKPDKIAFFFADWTDSIRRLALPK